MRCRAVPKAVRTDVWGVRHQRDPGMNHSTNGALIEATAAGAKEQGWPAVGGRQCRSASYLPPFNGPHSRDADGNGPLLVALAEHPDDMARLVNVVDVEADQLTDPNAGGVKQLQNRVVAQLLRADLAERYVGRGFEQSDRLGLGKDTRQPPLSLGSGQNQTGIGRQPRAPSAKSGEHSGGRRVPGDRRSRLTGGGQLGQPAAQDADVEIRHA